MGVFKQYMNHLASYEKDKQDSVNKIFTNLAMTTGVMFGACVGTRIYNKVLAKNNVLYIYLKVFDGNAMKFSLSKAF